MLDRRTYVVKERVGFMKLGSTYVISLGDASAGRREIAQLLLAAGLAVDTVFKEKDD